MAEYRISGIWKNSNDVITHYAFHKVEGKSMSNAKKTSKNDAVGVTEKSMNEVYTMTWNYKKASWTLGEEVHVVNGQYGKYLRSDPDNKLTDNLGHLIDFDWIV